MATIGRFDENDDRPLLFQSPGKLGIILDPNPRKRQLVLWLVRPIVADDPATEFSQLIHKTLGDVETEAANDADCPCFHVGERILLLLGDLHVRSPEVRGWRWSFPR